MISEEKSMKKAIKDLNKKVDQTYKPSLWYRFKDFMGIVALAFLLLLCLFGFFYLLVTLIENPVSLAIICVTILILFAFWRLR